MIKVHLTPQALLIGFSFLIVTACQRDQLAELAPETNHAESDIGYQELNRGHNTPSAAQLGRLIFFDKTLSNPMGQACGSCHAAEKAFTDPTGNTFSEGAVKGLFGNRQSPSVSYSVFSPALQKTQDEDGDEEAYIGGFFWDGRAKTLEEQASPPFFNPLEMNNKTKDEVVDKIRRGNYAATFKRIYGNSIFNDTEKAFSSALLAIAAFERTTEVNPFTSKYDYYLKGRVRLTRQEEKGLELFNNKGKCAACHPSTPQTDFGGRVLFTDYTYDNIGLPSNATNTHPEIDLGLGGFLKDAAHNGKFKVPTLRNVAITAPYFHNGTFNSLEQAVEFYNSRDLGNFGQPEFSETVNKEELGDLKLTKREVRDIVVFLNTLTDGYRPYH